MKSLDILRDIQSKLLDVNILDGIAIVSSRTIAEIFDKRHDNVLQSIQNCECSPEFGLLNFKESYYKNAQGKKQPEYLLTKNGFAFIAMGFTGKRAARFKEAYIRRFDEMEQFIHSRNLARLEYPELTDMIQSVYNNPAWHYYSNEADMINRIVLGKSAKQFREMCGLGKNDPIRDHITPWQADAIQKLQKVDVGLVASGLDFQARKGILQQYFNRLRENPRLTA